MKTILKDVQLAVAGTGEDGSVISGDLLRIIASNFNGNKYPRIIKDSPSQKGKTHEMVGYVTSVYFKECNGESALFGDLEFTQYYDMSTLKETFGNRVYPAIAISVSPPGYESLFQLAFTDDPSIKGMRMVNFRKCVCIGREENAQKILEQSVTLSFRKYDNTNSGLVGQISYNESQGDTIRVISSFIPAIRKYSNDKRSLALVGRIIAVAGTSPNCRLHEIEAAHKEELEKIIDRFVRDWHEGFPTTC